eukprot:scaffold169820_cov23-Prasinocladus_malaysianus.AAC.1
MAISEPSSSGARPYRSVAGAFITPRQAQGRPMQQSPDNPCLPETPGSSGIKGLDSNRQNTAQSTKPQ